MDQQLEELGRKKHLLEMQCNVLDPKLFAEDWLSLAGEYLAINARANHAYCMRQYREYAGIPTPETAPVENGIPLLESVFESEKFEPQDEFDQPDWVDENEDDTHFDWQNRADIGD